MKKCLALAFIAMALSFISCKSTDQEEAEDQTAVEQTQDEVQNQDEQTEDQVKDEDSNEALISKAEESRKNAVEKGAETYYADQLCVTDEMLRDLKEKASGSNKSLKNELNDVNYRYLALEKACETKNLKAKIEENGFDKENQIAYDAANVLLEQLEKAIQENADGKTMFKSAEATYAAYYAIYYDSFKKLAVKEREACVAAKKNADNVKAGVARKDEYKAAADTVQKGDTCFVTKNPEGAYDNYKSAKEKFTALYTEVSERRAEAQKKIDEAKAKVQNVNNFAEEADGLAPLGEEKIDGIEEEGTVLLEEDNFANPEEAVIDVEKAPEVENDSVIEVFEEKVSGGNE